MFCGPFLPYRLSFFNQKWMLSTYNECQEEADRETTIHLRKLLI